MNACHFDVSICVLRIEEKLKVGQGEAEKKQNLSPRDDLN